MYLYLFCASLPLTLLVSNFLHREIRDSPEAISALSTIKTRLIGKETDKAAGENNWKFIEIALVLLSRLQLYAVHRTTEKLE